MLVEHKQIYKIISCKGVLGRRKKAECRDRMRWGAISERVVRKRGLLNRDHKKIEKQSTKNI